MFKELFLLLIALVIPVFFAAVIATSAYNKLVALRNRYKDAFARIDLQLKRRYDLIPNLVETSKGYLTHEQGALEAVIAARNAASAAKIKAAQNPGDAPAMKQLAGAEAALIESLGRLFAAAEAYPELKANQTMITLMQELSSTEDKAAIARQCYNESVVSYNTARETVPTNLVAGVFHFQPAALFEIEIGEQRERPKASIS
jgi:LemA protein